MKFKKNAIKSGMVIHCPKDEDAMALLGYLDRLGYIDNNTIMNPNTNPSRYCRITEDRKYQWYCEVGNGVTITEFCDLIVSEMSAKEILQWLEDHEDTDEMYKLFGEMDIQGVFRTWTTDTIYKSIMDYCNDYKHEYSIEEITELKIYSNRTNELVKTIPIYDKEKVKEIIKEELPKYGSSAYCNVTTKYQCNLK